MYSMVEYGTVWQNLVTCTELVASDTNLLVPDGERAGATARYRCFKVERDIVILTCIMFQVCIESDKIPRKWKQLLHTYLRSFQPILHIVP